MGALALPTLPPPAHAGHVLPALSHSSLISIGCMCDADCTATFEKNKVTIWHNNQEILAGHRDYTTGLWRLPLEQNTVPLQCNNVYAPNTIAEQMQYLHAAAFSPVILTWIKPINKKGYFRSWPGHHMVENVQKHLPKSEATIKGHLDHIRENIRSTKDPINDIKDENNDIPSQEPSNEQTNMMFLAIKETNKVYTDQTGRFPVRSNRGNQCFLVLYCYGANAILTEPIKNHTEGELLRAYSKLHDLLQS
eukprot:scaffold7201_cov51-Attheya_sp.AAC.1